jgi:hypothetical protein
MSIRRVSCFAMDKTPTPETFAAIVNLWPSAEELAADLAEKGVTVRQWRNRDSIDAAYWARVVAAAEKRGFSQVTLALLARLAAERKGKAA